MLWAMISHTLGGLGGLKPKELKYKGARTPRPLYRRTWMLRVCNRACHPRDRAHNAGICGPMGLCTHVYRHVYIHTHIHTHVHIQMHIHTYTFPYTHTYTYTCTYIYTYTYTSIYMYMYNYINIYICIYIFIPVSKQREAHLIQCRSRTKR